MLPMTTKFPMSGPAGMPPYGGLYVGDRARAPGGVFRKIGIEMAERIMGAAAVYDTIA